MLLTGRSGPLDNPELAEIEASARAIVRRAYDLGRGEALRKVVEVLSDGKPAADHLALMAPEQTVPAVSHGVVNGAANGKTPWWAWRVR